MINTHDEGKTVSLKNILSESENSVVRNLSVLQENMLVVPLHYKKKASCI